MKHTHSFLLSFPLAVYFPLGKSESRKWEDISWFLFTGGGKDSGSLQLTDLKNCCLCDQAPCYYQIIAENDLDRGHETSVLNFCSDTNSLSDLWKVTSRNWSFPLGKVRDLGQRVYNPFQLKCLLFEKSTFEVLGSVGNWLLGVWMLWHSANSWYIGSFSFKFKIHFLIVKFCLGIFWNDFCSSAWTNVAEKG